MSFQQALAGPNSSVGMAKHLEDYNHLYGLTEEDISKALTIGDGSGPAASLVGESLDPVVHFLVLNGKAFTPTWRRLKTYQAKSYLEQFNVTTSLGKGRHCYTCDRSLTTTNDGSINNSQTYGHKSIANPICSSRAGSRRCHGWPLQTIFNGRCSVLVALQCLQGRLGVLKHVRLPLQILRA